MTLNQDLSSGDLIDSSFYFFLNNLTDFASSQLEALNKNIGAYDPRIPHIIYLIRNIESSQDAISKGIHLFDYARAKMQPKLHPLESYRINLLDENKVPQRI